MSRTSFAVYVNTRRVEFSSRFAAKALARLLNLVGIRAGIVFIKRRSR